MNIEKTYEKGVLTVKICGEIDHHTANEIRERLDMEIEERAIKRLVWDFKEVTFMDSSGIGVIVGRYKKLEAMGGETLIINLCPQVDKILKLSGIKGIIKCGEGDKDEQLYEAGSSCKEQ